MGLDVARIGSSWARVALWGPLVWLAVGCGNDVGYCIAEVDHSEGDGVTGPGFADPALDGITICSPLSVGQSFCRQLDGKFASADDYPNGGERFCEAEGYTYECVGGPYRPNSFVKTEADCPYEDDT